MDLFQEKVIRNRRNDRHFTTTHQTQNSPIEEKSHHQVRTLHQTKNIVQMFLGEITL